MKKEEIPQDKSALVNYFRELQYAKDNDGKYTTGLSTGWEIKTEALDQAWKDVKEKVHLTANKVKAGEVSPVAYYMELKLMDISILSAYTGFWKFTIKRHMKPAVFAKLSNDKLKKYADTFGISVEELKTFKG